MEPMIICKDCNSAVNVFDGECKCGPPPRASRMPPHMPSLDPTFLDAAFLPEQEAMVEEKLPEKLRRVGAI